MPTPAPRAASPSRGAAGRAPVLFWYHGAGGGVYSRFIEGYAASLRPAPRAVLVIEAHFESDPVAVAPGPVAARAKALLAAAGIPAADAGACRSHGPADVRRAFPAAPVTCVSVHRGQDAAAHLAVGAALAPLRDEGVLIVGSGVADFHNFTIGFGAAGAAHSRAFGAWLRGTLTGAVSAERRLALLRGWESAPSARASHPAGEAEHLMPLMVCAGAAAGAAATAVANPHRDAPDVAGGRGHSQSQFEWR